MQINFTVHQVDDVRETIQADVGGQMVPAVVEGVEVTLVSDHYGSLVLKFIGAEATEARAAFVVDDVKTWTI